MRLLLVLVALLLAPLTSNALLVQYTETLNSDHPALVNPDSRIRFESTSGEVITMPSGLGDGWLTVGPDDLFPTLSYQHAIEPIDPGVVIDEIVSASITMLLVDEDNLFNIAVIRFEGREGTGGTGGVQLQPFRTFDAFDENVSGLISVSDGVLEVTAWGLLPYRIVTSRLTSEYLTSGTSGSGGQPTMPEPHAAMVYALGILVAALAASRLRASRAASP